MMFDGVREAVNQFDRISLKELSSAHLMSRIDHKFVFPLSELSDILLSLKSNYLVLTPQNDRINSYKSLYFDTPSFDFYQMHHNKKNHRFKVRYRIYANTGVAFFEVKEKRKGRTNKSRVEVGDVKMKLSNNELEFIDELIPFNAAKLEAKLWNDYKRITLVSKNKKERLTLDFDLSFSWEEKTVKKNNVVIAELKQNFTDRRSEGYKAFKSKSIRPMRVSKYCMGVLDLYDENPLKHNRFKSKILKLNKIENDS